MKMFVIRFKLLFPHLPLLPPPLPSQVPNPYPEAEDDVHYIPPAATSSILSNKELSLEIQQMQSKLNSYGTDMLRSEFIMEDQGLGKIPTGIQTVGSILLFNSDTNPYKNYQALDNLISSGRFSLPSLPSPAHESRL
jgi:hypothetical protein